RREPGRRRRHDRKLPALRTAPDIARPVPAGPGRRAWHGHRLDGRDRHVRRCAEAAGAGASRAAENRRRLSPLAPTEGLYARRDRALLGLSRRMIAYYERGERPIPRVVALATRALEAA